MLVNSHPPVLCITQKKREYVVVRRHQNNTFDVLGEFL